MSEYNISFEIQAEIIKRLPIKSLIQFLSVSKPWKSLIDSSPFITNCNSQQQHLLVRYEDILDYTHKYVSLVDDDTFPHQKVSHSVPPSIKRLMIGHTIIGTSHGLVCLYGTTYPNGHEVVLWNISIRKSVTVTVPMREEGIFYTALGFGVCRETTDPKILKIRYPYNHRMESVTSIPYQVEVFALSTGAWRCPYSTNLPRTSFIFYEYNKVGIDGVFYWLAADTITMDGGFRSYDLIVSFDMTSEEFTEITLPDSIARNSYDFSLSYNGDSLVVCGQDEWSGDLNCCVWMMTGGVSISFTKLFTIAQNEAAILKGFWKMGEPIIEVREHRDYIRGRLVVYEPYYKHVDYLGIDGRWGTLFVYPYMETLLLLDQPDLMVYNKV